MLRVRTTLLLAGVLACLTICGLPPVSCTLVDNASNQHLSDRISVNLQSTLDREVTGRSLSQIEEGDYDVDDEPTASAPTKPLVLPKNALEVLIAITPFEICLRRVAFLVERSIMLLINSAICV